MRKFLPALIAIIFAIGIGGASALGADAQTYAAGTRIVQTTDGSLYYCNTNGIAYAVLSPAGTWTWPNTPCPASAAQVYPAAPVAQPVPVTQPNTTIVVQQDPCAGYNSGYNGYSAYGGAYVNPIGYGMGNPYGFGIGTYGLSSGLYGASSCAPPVVAVPVPVCAGFGLGNFGFNRSRFGLGNNCGGFNTCNFPGSCGQGLPPRGDHDQPEPVGTPHPDHH